MTLLQRALGSIAVCSDQSPHQGLGSGLFTQTNVGEETESSEETSLTRVVYMQPAFAPGNVCGLPPSQQASQKAALPKSPVQFVAEQGLGTLLFQVRTQCFAAFSQVGSLAYQGVGPAWWCFSKRQAQIFLSLDT